MHAHRNAPAPSQQAPSTLACTNTAAPTQSLTAPTTPATSRRQHLPWVIPATHNVVPLAYALESTDPTPTIVFLNQLTCK